MLVRAGAFLPSRVEVKNIPQEADELASDRNDSLGSRLVGAQYEMEIATMQSKLRLVCHSTDLLGLTLASFA